MSNIIQATYPNRFYAQYDPKAPQPALVVGWWDMWRQSCDISLLPGTDRLVALTEDQWNTHIGGPQSAKVVQNGNVVDYDGYVATPLKDQAQYALGRARTYVQNQYAILNEPTPDAWVTYLKSLMAIADGTDTKSTTLPTAPSESA